MSFITKSGLFQVGLTLLLSSFSAVLLSQTSLVSTWSVGGTGSVITRDVSAGSISSSRVISCGTFSGTIDFDPNSSVFNLTSQGGSDIFVQNIDLLNGSLIWAKRIGGIGTDEGLRVFNSEDAVYVSGNFNGTVDFDPGPGINYLSSNGAKDVFLLKLDINGNFLWAKSFGGPFDDELSSMDHGKPTDYQAGNDGIYLTGVFRGTVNFDFSGEGNSIATSNGGTDVFIEKIGVSGNFVWSRTFGGPEDDVVGDIDVWDNLTDNIHVIGDFSGTVDFNPGLGTFYLSNSSPGFSNPRAIFVLKLSPNGNFIWAKKIGHPQGQGWLNFGKTLATDYYDGSIYCGGEFSSTIDFDPGAGQYLVSAASSVSNGFILKLSANGNFGWVNVLSPSGTVVTPHDIDVLSGMNGGPPDIYTTGHYIGSVNFDLSGPNGNLNSSDNNVFITRHSADGTFRWVKSPQPAPGSTNSCGSMGFQQIDVFDHGGMAKVAFCGGFYAAQSDMDPTSGVFLLNNNVNGPASQDGFVTIWNDPLFGKISSRKVDFESTNLAGLVYPNPTFDVLYIKRAGDIGNLKLYDLNGNDLNIFSSVKEDCIELDVSTLDNGSYLIYYELDQTPIMERVIVLK